MRQYTQEDVICSIRESKRAARRKFRELQIHGINWSGRTVPIQHSDPVFRAEMVSLLEVEGAIVQVISEQDFASLIGVQDNPQARKDFESAAESDEVARKERLGDFADLFLLDEAGRRKLVVV